MKLKKLSKIIVPNMQRILTTIVSVAHIFSIFIKRIVDINSDTLKNTKNIMSFYYEILVVANNFVSHFCLHKRFKAFIAQQEWENKDVCSEVHINCLAIIVTVRGSCIVRVQYIPQ